MATIKEAVKLLTPWSWFIDLARNGDGSTLAVILRDHAKRAAEPLPPDVWRFLANVLDGKVKLKRRKKLTAEFRMWRYIREMQVVLAVRTGMFQSSRKRDRHLRTKLTQQWCEYYDTTPANVERYLHLPKSRRRTSW